MIQGNEQIYVTQNKKYFIHYLLTIASIVCWIGTELSQNPVLSSIRANKLSFHFVFCKSFFSLAMPLPAGKVQ